MGRAGVGLSVARTLELSHTISFLRMADNLYFLAPSTHILEMMMEDVVKLMSDAQAAVKQSSICFMMCGPQHNTNMTVTINTEGLHYDVEQVRAFQALGVSIDGRGSTVHLLDYRLLKAEALIGKHMPQLKLSKPWGANISFWHDVVCPSVILGLGLAHLAPQHLLRLQRWENKWPSSHFGYEEACGCGDGALTVHGAVQSYHLPIY